jgi:hypothetical protein
LDLVIRHRGSIVEDLGHDIGGAMTWIILPPERLIFAVGPEDKVYVQLRYSPEQTGLAPDVELAIALTPAEARAFSNALLRKAGEAEAAARNRQRH